MGTDQNYHFDIKKLMDAISAEQYNKTSLKVTSCNGLSEDSRKIKSGDIFIARPGLESDGRRFIHQAATRGAVAILCEQADIEQFVQAKNCPINVYAVNNIAKKLGQLGAIFYKNPSKKLSIVGVTGTNGKTSCTQLIAKVAEKLGRKTAVMGTLGNGRLGNLKNTGKTTIDALAVQKCLAGFQKDDFELVSMEVSSHALNQGRVNNVEFELALFTNLSREHLDYHSDMQSYAEAKKRLLTKDDLTAVIINADDATGGRLLNDSDITADKYSFSITPVNARMHTNSVWTESVVFHDSGIKAELATPWGNVEFKTSMIGQFNLSNCLAVITTMGVMGYSPKDVVAQLAEVSFVEGRMQRFGGEDKPLVLVDYAHTPDALKHVLQAIKPHTSHKLWTVFGCGGDRDRGKRAEMAANVEEYADYLVITSDNPRTEPVEDIVSEMLKGLSRSSACEVEYDRKAAIRNTISKAVLGDVVLIAGKGHENYQIIGKEKVPHNDVEIVEQALSQGSWQ